MKAQLLYDFREYYGFCSGMDLHEFFLEQTGEMSPRGRVEIDPTCANNFVEGCLEAMLLSNPSLHDEISNVLQEWQKGDTK